MPPATLGSYSWSCRKNKGFFYIFVVIDRKESCLSSEQQQSGEMVVSEYPPPKPPLKILLGHESFQKENREAGSEKHEIGGQRHHHPLLPAGSAAPLNLSLDVSLEQGLSSLDPDSDSASWHLSKVGRFPSLPANSSVKWGQKISTLLGCCEDQK